MITINLKGDALQDIAGKLDRIQEVLSPIGEYLTGSVINRINKGISPENAPLTVKNKKNKRTLRDTGRLIGSITYKVEGWSVAVGTNVLYGRILHFGGIITPVNGEKLAIPASWETRKLMRRHGGTVRSCLNSMKRAGWRIWFTEKAIMGIKGKRKPVVLFVRKNKVKIPPRPYLVIDKRDKSTIKRIIRAYMES